MMMLPPEAMLVDADYWSAFGAGLVIGLIFAALVYVSRDTL